MAIPLLVVTTYSYVRERDAARQSAQARALNIAILAQHEYQLRVDAARQLVTPGFPFGGAAAVTQIMANPQQCNAALADLLKRSPGYLNLFEVDLKGDPICSAIPSTVALNVADRDYFEQAMKTLKPAVGDPTIGRLTNKPSVVVGYPILDDGGKPVGLAAASLDLSTVVVLPAALELPAESSVTLLDRTGTVMARNMEPEKWIGKPGPSLVGLSSVIFEGANGVAAGTGVDGVPRLYGVVPLRAIPDGPVQGTLLVGISTRTAYGPADSVFRENLFWLAAVCTLATVAAWLSTERLVVAPLYAITTAIRRISGGAFDTRTGLASMGGEMGMIATAIDEMAARLAATLSERDQDRREMASLLATAPSVISIVREDGTVTRVNEVIKTQFGWPAEEFVGHDLNTLFDEPVFPARAGGEGRRLIESRGRRRDGSTFPLEIEIRDVEGSIGQRYVAVLRDLTERQRIEAEREQARVATARAEFLRTLSHELRSPLTAVLGFAELIQTAGVDALVRRQAQDIEGAGHHMLALVEDLLDLARIDAGHWDVNIQPVNVGELLQTVTEGFRAEATARDLDLVLSAMPPMIVDTDARVLREVTTNLIENAIKYTEKGGVHIRVELDRDMLVLVVSDTGIGIPHDRLESIFNEFERVRPTDSQPGTGLGLAITRRLVTLVRGTVAASSTLGAGSVFTVCVPVRGRGA